MIEGKRKDSRTTFVGYGFSPAIATAVTFSFTHYERHKSLSAMIPTLQISTESFAIFMYDCCKDYLIGAIFEWTMESLVFLWAVLHYCMFQSPCDELILSLSGYLGDSRQLEKGFTASQGFMYKANIQKLRHVEERDMRLRVYSGYAGGCMK